jgi:hypothetical protein
LESDEKTLWKKPLETSSDCWMNIEGKMRWVPGAKKWFVSMLGPPPIYGEWNRCDIDPDDPYWEWIPNGLTDDPFVLEVGVWIFYGKKPEFVEGAWLFSGYYPKMLFCHANKTVTIKFQGNEEYLEMAENSDQSRSAAELMERSLHEDRRIPREADAVLSNEAAKSQPVTQFKKIQIQPAPDYLRRLPCHQAKSSRPDGDSLALNPLAAAFYASELMRRRDLCATEMLWKLCEYLKQICGGGQIEIWIATDAAWKCVQHEDLLDMSLFQKMKAAGPKDLLIRSGDQRAVLIVADKKQLGALIVGDGKASLYTDYELLSFAKLLLGILTGMKSEEVMGKKKIA